MEISLATAGIIALITALIQVAKGFSLKPRYAPIAAIVLGIGYYTLIVGGVSLTGVDIINGIATGLSSVGLYSVGGKEVLKILAGNK